MDQQFTVYGGKVNIINTDLDVSDLDCWSFV